MQKTEIDLMYVHSPITYSIGRYLYDNNYLKNQTIVFCGRNTSWPYPYIEVQDDGIWITDRVCTFLKLLCDEIEEYDDFNLNLYLPHTGLLLGRILLVSDVVKNIYYIEEGDSAYDPRRCENIWQTPDINMIELIQKLDQLGITDKLKINREALFASNQQPGCFYDIQHPKYTGAFRISTDAFEHAKNAELIQLQQIDIIPESDNIWVCMLPCLTDYIYAYENDRARLNQIIYGLVKIFDTLKAMADNQNAHIIIKMHPIDVLQLDKEFRQTFYNYGTAYDDFYNMNDLPIGFETALYNFSQFIVVGASSAKRYIEILQGKDKLIALNLE